MASPGHEDAPAPRMPVVGQRRDWQGTCLSACRRKADTMRTKHIAHTQGKQVIRTKNKELQIASSILRCTIDHLTTISRLTSRSRSSQDEGRERRRGCRRARVIIDYQTTYPRFSQEVTFEHFRTVTVHVGNHPINRYETWHCTDYCSSC